MMAKRGVALEMVHFFSYPYTSPEAKEKVLELAKLLTPWCGRLTVHVVPFTAIQEELRRKCPEELFTLLMRRFMMRIAEEVASGAGPRPWSPASVWARWPARPHVQPHPGSLRQGGECELRVTAKAAAQEQAQALLLPTVDKLKALSAPWSTGGCALFGVRSGKPAAGKGPDHRHRGKLHRRAHGQAAHRSPGLPKCSKGALSLHQ